LLREREREREREEGGTDLYDILLLSTTLTPIGSAAKNKAIARCGSIGACVYWNLLFTQT